jgi:3-methyladenine DNA glycosylase/8-oxoguanine DNA glycosylase
MRAMSGKLSDLNSHLFAQLDRLTQPGLSAEQIALEVKRADAIVSLADQVTDTARVQLQAAKLFSEHGDKVLKMLPQIGKASE